MDESQYRTMEELEINSLDRENLLESLTLELMTDNIVNQINGDMPSSTDFLSIVVSRFNTILQEDVIEDVDKAEVKHQMIDFCDNLLCIIADDFGIAINMISEDYNTYINTLTTLYNFLILGKYSNVENFLVEYISNNKQELIETLGFVERGKDIVSISNRKKNLNKDNIALLSNINAVIDFITTSDIIDYETFMNTIDDGEYHLSNLKELYADGTIIGDFVPTLFSLVIGDEYDNGEFARIRNSIRVILSQEIITEYTTEE